MIFILRGRWQENPLYLALVEKEGMQRSTLGIQPTLGIYVKRRRSIVDDGTCLASIDIISDLSRTANGERAARHSSAQWPLGNRPN
jgi:hypothetical protein